MMRVLGRSGPSVVSLSPCFRVGCGEWSTDGTGAAQFLLLKQVHNSSSMWLLVHDNTFLKMFVFKSLTGSCLNVLWGIAVSSLPKKSLLHCRFIQSRLFFFCITVPDSGWKHLKCEETTASNFMVYMCLREMKRVRYWLKNR